VYKLAQSIQEKALPIKCLEATSLAIALTREIPNLQRFSLRFKTRVACRKKPENQHVQQDSQPQANSNGDTKSVYWHIVCALALHSLSPLSMLSMTELLSGSSLQSQGRSISPTAMPSARNRADHLGSTGTGTPRASSIPRLHTSPRLSRPSAYSQQVTTVPDQQVSQVTSLAPPTRKGGVPALNLTSVLLPRAPDSHAPEVKTNTESVPQSSSSFLPRANTSSLAHVPAPSATSSEAAEIVSDIESEPEGYLDFQDYIFEEEEIPEEEQEGGDHDEGQSRQLQLKEGRLHTPEIDEEIDGENGRSHKPALEEGDKVYEGDYEDTEGESASSSADDHKQAHEKGEVTSSPRTKKNVRAPKREESHDEPLTLGVRFGSLGLSRRSDLGGYASLPFASLAELVAAYFIGYGRVGHIVEKVIIGLPPRESPKEKLHWHFLHIHTPASAYPVILKGKPSRMPYGSPDWCKAAHQAMRSASGATWWNAVRETLSSYSRRLDVIAGEVQRARSCPPVPNTKFDPKPQRLVFNLDC